MLEGSKTVHQSIYNNYSIEIKGSVQFSYVQNLQGEFLTLYFLIRKKEDGEGYNINRLMKL